MYYFDVKYLFMDIDFLYALLSLINNMYKLVKYKILIFKRQQFFFFLIHNIILYSQYIKGVYRMLYFEII